MNIESAPCSKNFAKFIFAFGVTLQALFVCFLILFLTNYFWGPPAQAWPGGFSQPGLALQLPRSVDNVHSIFEVLGKSGIEEQMHAVALDSICFIPLYWAVFSLLGWIQIKHGAPLQVFAGYLLVALITVAAFCDYKENAGITKLLAFYPRDPLLTVVKATHGASVLKWTFTFMATCMISPLFLRKNRWISGVGIYFFAVAAIGLLGICSCYSLVEAAFELIAIGFLFVGIAFCSRPFRKSFEGAAVRSPNFK